MDDLLDQRNAVETMCTGKQRHESRAAARIEVSEKNQSTGRRHTTFGCPFCLGIHVKVATSKTGVNKKHRRRYSHMGA